MFGPPSNVFDSILYGDLDDDDDDDYEMSLLHQELTRDTYHFYDRLNLKTHFEMCCSTKNGFESRYHVSEISYQKLCHILNDKTFVSFVFDSTGNTPITVNVVVCIGLRFMGGEKEKSLCDIFGMSLTACRKAIDAFLLAVDNSKDDQISIDLLPQTQVEKTKVKQEWKIISNSFSIMNGHLGPLDGWLCITNKPWDVTNPVDYFSGHYQRFGLNVQAMCDAHLRIIYFCVCGPGKMNDAKAFRRLKGLHKWLGAMMKDEFISGDNAYRL